MRYLTVQDLLWINLQVTQKSNPFEFDKLEESVNYQYGYGGSCDVLAQAENFLSGFKRNAPFSAGNDKTAEVAHRAFLLLNGQGKSLGEHQGHELSVEDAILSVLG